jgi:hypothetical protein
MPISHAKVQTAGATSLRDIAADLDLQGHSDCARRQQVVGRSGARVLQRNALRSGRRREKRSGLFKEVTVN